MIIYLICLLVIGLIIAWNIKKAPSDKDLWGDEFRSIRISEFIFLLVNIIQKTEAIINIRDFGLPYSTGRWHR